MVEINELKIDGYELDKNFFSDEDSVEYTSVASEDDFIHITETVNLTMENEPVLVVSFFFGCSCIKTLVFNSVVEREFLEKTIKETILKYERA